MMLSTMDQENNEEEGEEGEAKAEGVREAAAEMAAARPTAHERPADAGAFEPRSADAYIAAARRLIVRESGGLPLRAMSAVADAMDARVFHMLDDFRATGLGAAAYADGRYVTDAKVAAALVAPHMYDGDFHANGFVYDAALDLFNPEPGARRRVPNLPRLAWFALCGRHLFGDASPGCYRLVASHARQCGDPKLESILVSEKSARAVLDVYPRICDRLDAIWSRSAGPAGAPLAKIAARL